MIKVPLTGERGKGKFALVDDEFEYLLQSKWYLTENSYVVYRKEIGGKKQTVRLHRVINGTPIGFVTDHINGNKLDNRTINLRTANKSLNGFNSKIRTDNTSGYRGVSWYARHRKWRVRIGNKQYGLFADKQEAINVHKKLIKNYV